MRRLATITTILALTSTSPALAMSGTEAHSAALHSVQQAAAALLEAGAPPITTGELGPGVRRGKNVMRFDAYINFGTERGLFATVVVRNGVAHVSKWATSPADVEA